MLEKYVKTMEGYNKPNPNKTNTMVKQSLETIFAYIYLENSDHDKDRSIIQSPNSQKSLANDHYTRMIVETNNMLSNNKFDINKNKKQDHNH